MSIQVRISDDVSARVGERAGLERRSFANMVEVLLLKALDDGTVGEPAVRAVFNDKFRSDPEGLAFKQESVPTGVQTGGVVRPHMKKNRPAVECPTRWPSGTCPDCGTVVT